MPVSSVHGLDLRADAVKIAITMAIAIGIAIEAGWFEDLATERSELLLLAIETSGGFKLAYAEYINCWIFNNPFSKQRYYSKAISEQARGAEQST